MRNRFAAALLREALAEGPPVDPAPTPCRCARYLAGADCAHTMGGWEDLNRYLYENDDHDDEPTHARG